MINNPNPASSVNAPRGIVHINGKKVLWDQFEVINQNYYQADTFQMQLPLLGQPNGVDLDYWLSQSIILVEIFAGFPKNPNSYSESDLDSIFFGTVEPLETQKISGIVSISGRDLISKFIDNKIYEKYPNNTSSQIVEKLCTKEGLKFNVVPTTTPVGQYYNIDYVQNLNSTSTEWDLITYLAQKENYLAYMKGQVFNFVPIPIQTADAYLLNCFTPPDGSPIKGNFTDIKVSRDLTRSRDIIVEVKTFNMRTGHPQTITVKATPNKSTYIKGMAQPIGEAQVFSYVKTNYTPEQALAWAQQQILALSSQERLLWFTDDYNNTLQKNSIIQLKGYSPSADQTYYPSSITRSMHFDGGASIEVNAKNHSPNTVKIVA